MRHDHDRDPVGQLADEVLDPARGLGIERRGGLVHEEHLRLDRERPCDAVVSGIAAIGPIGETEKYWLPMAVKTSGADSPAPRAIAGGLGRA